MSHVRAGLNQRRIGAGRILVFKDLPNLHTDAAPRGRPRRDRKSETRSADGYFRKLAEASAIANRFDADYYRHEYPDIDFDRFKPIEHFLEAGWVEGRNPNAFFDTVSYLQAYPDVDLAGINPYCHYLTVGVAEGRQAWSSVTPSTRARLLFGRPVADWVNRIAPHIDERFYRKQFREPLLPGVNLVAHYAFRGWREGKRPNPDFDPTSVARKELLDHYLVNPLLIGIEAEARAREDLELTALTEPPGPDVVKTVTATCADGKAGVNGPDTRSQLELVASEFDAAYYCNRNPDIVDAGIDPLEHFFYTGWREGRDPGANFHTSFYLETYPDVSAGESNPFWHFLAIGRAEGRLGHPHKAVVALVAENRPAAAADSGAAGQLALVQSEFDVAHYLASYPDVAVAGIDPLQHFFFTGWREGRNPNPAFDCRYYLDANEDVRDAGLNPFWHFLVSGRTEGRLPKRPGGYKRASIDAAVVPSQRAAIDPDPEETEINAKELSARLERIRKKRRTGLVVSFSHDCYIKVIGGTQIFISDEQKRFNEQDYGYLHISPQLARLSLAPRAERFLVRVVADGDYVGLVALKSVTGYLKAKRKYRQGVRTMLVVHCVLGFHVPDIMQLARDFGPDRSVYWLHDYSSLCPGFNLMRNDAEYCGAPPKESLACRVCVYGQERSAHLSALATLFETCHFDVVSPSQYTLDLWLRSTDLPRRSAVVHPHWRLLPLEGSARAVSHGPLPIAFLGFPSANKGWPMLEEIVRRLDKDQHIRFFHLAARNVATLPNVQFVRTEVTAEDRQAAQTALAQHGIKILLLLSPWPETFSFVLHEAVAAGAYIFCLADSGNVADVVKQEQIGKIFLGIDDLVDFIGSGAAARFVSEADAVRPAYRIESSGTTASLSVNPGGNS